jgi:ferredoxin
MRVSINRDLCEANEVCVRFCPKVFRVDEEEKLAILVDPIPEDLRSAVEDAVRSCPRQALTLEN